MIAWCGNLALALGVLASAVALGACLAGLRRPSEVCVVVGRRALAGAGVLVLMAAGALAMGFLRDDFSLVYVAAHSERSLSPGLKLGALWSGQEGSLLLWAALAGALSAVAAWRRGRPEAGQGVMIGTLATIAGFFSAVVLFAANPFQTQTPSPTDGAGLSPLLRHWAMVMHPPVLFAGYGAFAVPFALALGAVVSGRGDDAWLTGMRRWALGAWALLTAGIALGAWWAYVQLGWGGYWAWDPVENASLLPWLTGTALVHTISVQRRRAVLRAWTFLLAAATFLLCVLGTLLTRGGIVESVHAFAGSSMRGPFLILLGAGIAGTALTFVLRRSALRDSHPIDRLLSREGIVLVAALILVLMAATTLAGTLLPALAGVLGRPGLSVGPVFYHRAVVPLGLLAAVLLAFGPMLPAAGDRVNWRTFAVPGVAAAAAVGAAAALGEHYAAMLACIAVSIFAVVSLIRLMVLDLSAGGRGLLARFGALRARARHEAGHLAHAGAALLLLGVAGSSLHTRVVTGTLRAGESLAIGDHTLRLEAVRQVRHSDHTAVESVLWATGPGGTVVTLRPRQRFFDRDMEASGEVDVSVGWREDLYVALVGWERGGAMVTIQARLNPLTGWIWAGAIVMVGAAGIGLLPRPARGGAVPDARPAGSDRRLPLVAVIARGMQA